MPPEPTAAPSESGSASGRPTERAATSERAFRLARAADRLLERLTVRIVLSIAIIVSLLPVPAVERLDMVFLGIFGLEFSLRVLILAYGYPGHGREASTTDDDEEIATEGRRRAGTIALLIIDFVALLSFLPLASTTGGTRFLRLFRLSRMILLFGYWAPLVRDLLAVMARRERMKQVVLMGFVVAGLSFAGALFVFHVGQLPVDADGDGVVGERDRGFVSLLWWSFRQVQDPGNMLSSPDAAPLVITSLMLTVFGLFLVSFLIGLGTDIVRELLERAQLRPPGLSGHTVIVNITPSTRRLLSELIRYYRKLIPDDTTPLSREWFSKLFRSGLGRAKYLVVGADEEPPDFLRQPELSSIVYRERAKEDEALIARADLLAARRIVLLANPEEARPDAATIQTLLTLVQRIAARERGSGTGARARQRVVIAEILDESNVAAATAAVRSGTGSFRAFVVPTERLLALFVAGVVRRPGLGELLEELLTSKGNEIYTCFFAEGGLGFSLDEPPRMPPQPAVAMHALLARGLSRAHDGHPTIVPLGLLSRARGTDVRDFEVRVGAGRGATLRSGAASGAGADETDASASASGSQGGRTLLASAPIGFIGIADNFGSVRRFAQDLADHPDAPAVPEPSRRALARPGLRRAKGTPIQRVLICGFRPGSIYMIEELLRGSPQAQVLVLVVDEAERREAQTSFEAHSQLVAAGQMPARHAMFTPDGEGDFEFISPDDEADGQAAPRRTVHVRVADWMESRHLVDLPHPDFDHVGGVDAVVFVAEEDGHSDPRTTTALLKLEGLFTEARTPKGRPRVVAEVFDARLAARLEGHFHTTGRHHVRVYSIQALRAFFLFQSVVVPGFDRVYSELLGSWGQSFVRVVPTGAIDPKAHGEFGALAVELSARGCLLVAVVLDDGAGGSGLHVAPAVDEPGWSFRWAAVQGLWVIAHDRGDLDLGRVVQDAASRRSSG